MLVPVAKECVDAGVNECLKAVAANPDMDQAGMLGCITFWSAFTFRAVALATDDIDQAKLAEDAFVSRITAVPTPQPIEK